MLEIDSIRFSYRLTPVLNGVECTLRTGEIFGILGRNGSGKTTFFRIVMGIIACRQGQVRFNHNIIKTRHRVFGYLPQHSFLFRHERVGKIIRMFYPRDGRSREKIEGDDRIKNRLK